MSLADVNAANAAAAPISGTTTGIEPGRTVTLVVSDADPATPDVTVTAMINSERQLQHDGRLVRLDGRPAERDRVGHRCGRQRCDGERHGRASIRAPASR
ncbi:hypothetical protein MASR2M50_04360 [Thauera sp.]